MLLRPWDSPGKNTGVGCRFLLQEIFPTQGSNPGLPHCRQMLYHLSHQGSSEKHLLLLYWLCQSLCVNHNKLWKILKEIGISNHLTCLLRNLYAAQEATVRTGHGTTDWSWWKWKRRVKKLAYSSTFRKRRSWHLVPSLHGKKWKQCQTLFLGAPKSLQMVTAAMKLKDAYYLEGKLWPT